MTAPAPLPVIERMLARMRGWTGIDDDQGMDISMRRKQFIVSVVPFLIVGLVMFYNIVFGLTGNHALIVSGLVQLPIAGGGAIVIRRVQQRWPELAHLPVAATLIGVLFMAITSGQGTLLGAHYYFLVLSMVVCLAVPVTRWKSSLLISMVSLSFFLWFEFNPVAADEAMQQIPRTAMILLRVILFVSMAVVMFVAMFFNEMFATLLERKMEEIATTDALTGLPNRRGFQMMMARELAGVVRYGGRFSVGVIDVDHFKRINDSWGHDTGDAVLCHIANTLKAALRATDTVVRLGGEELVLLMPNTGLDAAIEVCDRLRHVMEISPYEFEEGRVGITFSVGVTEWAPGMTERTLLDEADQALYGAKNDGRNCVRSKRLGEDVR